MGSIDPETAAWQEIVAQKRVLRDAALKPYLVNDLDHRAPRVDHVSLRSAIQTDSRVQQITDIDNVPELHRRLIEGEFTAEEVVLAYVKRATVAHQLTNALTEIVFDDALKQAKELDAEFQATKKIRGPLHGIPFTVKDQFNVKGHDTTLGYVGRSFNPATEDAVIVKILKDLGAIVIAKTNLPQSIMWCETENPLWGLTVHPRNPDFTPGGSTGGEAALLALHGTAFGLGTDIGGSVRIPQQMLGSYGFKPSSSRVPYHGVPVSTEGQEHVPSAVGYMCRDLETTTYISKLVANSQPWKLDPRCSPLSWNETAFQEVQSRPLVIGLIVDDGVARVHPPIARALKELSEALRSQGHEIMAWDTSDHAELVEILDLYYTVDGGEDIRRDVAAAGEPFLPHVEALVNRGQPISVYEYWQLNRRKLAAQKRYLDRWNAARSQTGKPVDVILSPTMPHTAVPHRTCRWVGYTKVWNVLDYPAITFPVDKVRPEKDTLPASEPAYVPRSDLDAWLWNLYDPERMAGHPVSLQVIGQKLEEEKLLGALAVIEKIWKASQKP